MRRAELGVSVSTRAAASLLESALNAVVASQLELALLNEVVTSLLGLADYPKNFTFGLFEVVVRSLPVLVTNLETASGRDTPPMMLNDDLIV